MDAGRFGGRRSLGLPRLRGAGRPLVGIAVAATIVAISVGAWALTVPAAAANRITVFAAASLTDALRAAADAYRASHPDVEIALAFGSSAALRTQIEQGAPADLFLSADLRNAQVLADAGHADGVPVPFAANRLAIVVPADSPAAIDVASDLARPGLRIIAAGDQVPITAYARQLVANLGARPGAPAGFAAAYEANVVSREDDVRSVLAKIELGEGDAAIVYATDAAGSVRVRTIPIPDGANVAVIDAGVVVAGSSRLAGARALLEWLAGPDGQAILARYGFSRP
jgi:molybdate transport system substrate-binding protein